MIWDAPVYIWIYTVYTDPFEERVYIYKDPARQRVYKYRSHYIIIIVNFIIIVINIIIILFSSPTLNYF